MNSRTGLQISVVTLALGLGIFVQGVLPTNFSTQCCGPPSQKSIHDGVCICPAGIGAFSFASNFEDPACFTTQAATRLKCHFEVGERAILHGVVVDGSMYHSYQASGC